MALTALSMRNDVWMDGLTVNGQDLRLEQTGAFLTGASPSGSTGIAARPGLRYGTGDPLKITASSGMTLAVSAGIAWVQGSAAANSGMYTGCLDTAGTVTLATSDPTNPRIDNIIVQVIDNGDGTSTTKVTPQTGTPAGSPVAPTLPANSLLLAQVAVAASTSTIVAGNITDKRVYTCTAGGIVVMANTTGGISGLAGLYGHDLATGRLRVSDGSGNARGVKTGSFTPVVAQLTSTLTVSPNTTSTIASVSVTTDGATEIKIQGTCSGFGQSTAHAGDWVQHQLQLDGVNVSGGRYYWVQQGSVGGGLTLGGGTFTAYVTPSAGSHTISWTLTNSSASTQSVSILSATSADYATLRVGPAFN